jgi:hypothetical protein
MPFGFLSAMSSVSSLLALIGVVAPLASLTFGILAAKTGGKWWLIVSGLQVGLWIVGFILLEFNGV